MAERSRYPANTKNGRDVTCTYKRDDGQLVLSRIGHGASYEDAIYDCDCRLPPGVWTRLVVSTPNSIYTDIANQGAGRKGRGWRFKYENVTVTVDPPRVS